MSALLAWSLMYPSFDMLRFKPIPEQVKRTGGCVEQAERTGGCTLMSTVGWKKRVGFKPLLRLDLSISKAFQVTHWRSTKSIASTLHLRPWFLTPLGSRQKYLQYALFTQKPFKAKRSGDSIYTRKVTAVHNCLQYVLFTLIVSKDNTKKYKLILNC